VQHCTARKFTQDVIEGLVPPKRGLVAR